MDWNIRNLRYKHNLTRIIFSIIHIINKLLWTPKMIIHRSRYFAYCLNVTRESKRWTSANTVAIFTTDYSFNDIWNRVYLTSCFRFKCNLCIVLSRLRAHNDVRITVSIQITVSHDKSSFINNISDIVCTSRAEVLCKVLYN